MDEFNLVADQNGAEESDDDRWLDDLNVEAEAIPPDFLETLPGNHQERRVAESDLDTMELVVVGDEPMGTFSYSTFLLPFVVLIPSFSSFCYSSNAG